MSATASRTEVSQDLALDMYRRMTLIRGFEEKSAEAASIWGWPPESGIQAMPLSTASPARSLGASTRIVGQEIDGWWSITLDLRLVENAVPPRKHASAATPLLLGIPVIGILAAIVDLPEDNRGGLLALANLGTQRLPLTIAGPASGTVACSLRRDPQAENVGSPVSLAGAGVDGARGR